VQKTIEVFLKQYASVHMIKIKFHNSKVRKKEIFEPIDPSNVRMYLCGPTVYDRAHLGNARNVIVFDVLFRFFREVFGARYVKYVRNFTDIDDKINQRAKDIGKEIKVITMKLSHGIWKIWSCLEILFQVRCLKLQISFLR